MAVAGQVAVKFIGDTAEYSKATDRVIKDNEAVGLSAKQLAAEHARIKDAITAPVEKYRAEMEKLKQVKAAGLLSDAEFKKASTAIAAKFKPPSDGGVLGWF